MNFTLILPYEPVKRNSILCRISKITLLSVSPLEDSEEEGEGVRAWDGAFGQREDRYAAAAGRAEERAQPVHGRHRDRQSPPSDHPARGRPGLHIHCLRYRDEMQLLSSIHYTYYLHTWYSYTLLFLMGYAGESKQWLSLTLISVNLLTVSVDLFLLYLNFCSHKSTFMNTHTHTVHKHDTVSWRVSWWLTVSSLVCRRRRQLWAGHWRWCPSSYSDTRVPPQTNTSHLTSPAAPHLSPVNPAHHPASLWCPDYTLLLSSTSTSSHRLCSGPRSAPSSAGSSRSAPSCAGSAYCHRSRRGLPPISDPGCQSRPASQSQAPDAHRPFAWSQLLHPTADRSGSCCHRHSPADSCPAHRTHHRPPCGSPGRPLVIPPPNSLPPGRVCLPAHHGGPHHSHLHPSHPAARPGQSSS